MIKELTKELDEMYNVDEIGSDGNGAALPDRGWLLPNQIRTDERFNVRRYDSHDEDEHERIAALAESIERDGQLDDIILVPADENTNVLVMLAGHRRRRAVALINERRSAVNKPLLRLRYQVNREGGDLFRKAVISNLQRRDFSPMDLMLLIRRIREDHSWVGFPGAKRVAQYLGLSVASITQHEKFGGLDMDDDLAHRLHHGEISAQSAYDLLGVHADKRQTVLNAAAEIQHDRNIDQAIHAAETGKASAEQAAEKLHAQRRIENPAIRQAIRETPGATQIPHPMSRKEIAAHLMQFDSDAYGYPDGAVRTWLRALEILMNGEAGPGGEKKVIALFDAAVRGADKGSGKNKVSAAAGAAPDKSNVIAKLSRTGRSVRRDRNMTRPRGKPAGAVKKSAHSKLG